MGHLDLAAFHETLREVDYRGAIAMECDVQAVDGWQRMALVRDPAVFDAYAATAIETLRAIETSLGAPHLPDRISGEQAT
jgi:hypothetical protein